MTDAHGPLTNPNKRPRIFEDNDAEVLSPAYSKTPWTASRCYRLLRPIESKIGVLRKAKGKDTNIAEEKEAKRRKLDNEGSLEREKTPGSHRSSEEENSSPLVRRRDVEGEGEWVPNPSKPRGVLRHSYKYGRLNKNRQTRVGTVSKSRLGENTPPGQLSLPTPFISKHFGTGHLDGAGTDGSGAVGQSPGVLCERGMNAEGGARKRQRLQGSWEVHNPSCGSIFKETSQRATESHLAKDLSQLLYATNSSTQRMGGSRSLLSMCLRKLPAVICQEQEEVDKLEPEQGYDVSTHVYNYLEDEYSLTYGTWKPLRELARAHGVDTLCNGIKDGLIPADVSKMLYLAARKSKAPRESRQILDAIVWLQQSPIAPPASGGASLADIPGLELLDKEHVLQFISGEKRAMKRSENFCDPVSDIFNQLAHLLLCGLLPLEWVSAADVNMMLKVAIHSLARGDKHALEASGLVETTLAMTIGVWNSTTSEEVRAVRLGIMDASHSVRAQVEKHITRYTTLTLPTAMQATISSLLALMTAIEILQIQHEPSGDKSILRPKHINPMISRLSIAIQQRCELDLLPPQQESLRSPIRALEASQVLLGQFLSGRLSSSSYNENHEPGGSEISLFETFAEILNSFDIESDRFFKFETGMAKFVDDIVRVCGRAHVDKGFALLQQIVALMTHVPAFPVHCTKVQSFFGKAAIDSAMIFAERIATKECFEWAASVSKAMGESLILPRAEERRPSGASKSNKPVSFLWDDVICEWVQEIAVPRQVAVAVGCGPRIRRTGARVHASITSSSCASANASEAEPSSTAYSTSGRTISKGSARIVRSENEKAVGTKTSSHAARRLQPRQHQGKHQHFQPQLLPDSAFEQEPESQQSRPRPGVRARLPASSTVTVTDNLNKQAKTQGHDSDSDDVDELSSNMIALPSSLFSTKTAPPITFGPREKWRPQSSMKRESGHSAKTESESESESDELSFDMSTQKPERKISGKPIGNENAIVVDEGSSEDELCR